MSRRSDREGIAPEGLSNPITSRWLAARCLERAAEWRRRINSSNSLTSGEICRSAIARELADARDKRTQRDWAVLP